MNILLFITAALLGLLAFFEPCTIATHTLFAVRAHAAVQVQRRRALMLLIGARALLLSLIFGIAATVGLEALSTGTAMLMLSVIGLVYLVSRSVYIPIPHLEFFRLLPQRDALAQSLKLGLTLPACTLPLVLIVAVLSALTQQPLSAMLAGLLFAAMFTLPTVWGVTHGLGIQARAFLAQAAALSPYLTTLLLWSAAFTIWQIGV